MVCFTSTYPMCLNCRVRVEGRVISALGVTARSLFANNNNNNVLTLRDVTKTVMAAIGVEATESVGNRAEGAPVEEAFPILSQQLRWESRAMTVEEAQTENKSKEKEVSLLQQRKCNELVSRECLYEVFHF